ncbi:hypothetical protein [Bacillus solitudinis]|uniref:hypothetical protein n=1 Tax=Bacillus solitudinis TaxID=2014074 RepID=UPI000C24D30D|nr:hypothetical protein [Bacillus solitudinis]
MARKRRGDCETDFDYIALGDGTFEHGWKQWQREEIAELLNLGHNVWDIGKRYDRDPDEVTVLALDLARSGKVKRAYEAFTRAVS